MSRTSMLPSHNTAKDRLISHTPSCANSACMCQSSHGAAVLSPAAGVANTAHATMAARMIRMTAGCEMDECMRCCANTCTAFMYCIHMSRCDVLELLLLLHACASHHSCIYICQQIDQRHGHRHTRMRMRASHHRNTKTRHDKINSMKRRGQCILRRCINREALG